LLRNRPFKASVDGVCESRFAVSSCPRAQSLSTDGAFRIAGGLCLVLQVQKTLSADGRFHPRSAVAGQRDRLCFNAQNISSKLKVLETTISILNLSGSCQKVSADDTLRLFSCKIFVQLDVDRLGR